MHRFSHRLPKPPKTCAIVRYGAIGDQLQTSSIFPLLKAEGYHITMYTVPGGMEALFNNPFVDRFIVQDVDVVPNAELGAFWKYLAGKYDKFVNLSESVERTLLAMPGNINHGWPQTMRHKHLNKNYLEFMHDIAGVPYKPAPRFYPTEAEKAWALEERARIGGTIVMWAMAGTAFHKYWPHLDEAVTRLTQDGLNIVTSGDELQKMLEVGFETNPRIFPRCGQWKLRQSLAFAQVADLVMGPETGLLNAVSFEPVPKIVMLSHSSVENLTRDWINCTSLIPQRTPCYPCHRLHYDFEFCEKGYMEIDGQKQHVGALCQVNIPVDIMVKAVFGALNMGARHVANG